MGRAVKILIGLFVLAGGAQWYISGNAESYLREYLDTFSKASQGALRIDIVKFEKGFTGSRAQLGITVIDMDSKGKSAGTQLMKESVDVDIEHGPVMFRHGMDFGLIKIHGKQKLSGMNSGSGTESTDTNVVYSALIGFGKSVYDRIDIGAIHRAAKPNEPVVDMEPVVIKGTHDLGSLAGRLSAHTASVKAYMPKTKERIEILRPFLETDIKEVFDDGLMIGSTAIGVKKLHLSVAGKGGKIEDLEYAAAVNSAVEKKGDGLADLKLSAHFESLNKAARLKAKGIKEADIEIVFSDAGMEGLRELARLNSERSRLRARLAKAVSSGNDAEMQKIILLIEDLRNRVVPIYNKLLIKGKTTLAIRKTLKAEETSSLNIRLKYTGEKLKGSLSSAMFSLAAQADRIVEGEFDMKLSKRLVRTLDANAAAALKSLKNRNIVEMKNGFYILKGEIKNGKIEINGIKYTPQQLMVLFLMH